MKKTKIKKTMLAIPELLRQCLLGSLLYKLTPLSLDPPNLFPVSPFSSPYWCLLQQANPPIPVHQSAAWLL